MLYFQFSSQHVQSLQKPIGENMWQTLYDEGVDHLSVAIGQIGSLLPLVILLIAMHASLKILYIKGTLICGS